MANPRSNLDELMKDPKAAGLLKNKALLQSLMQSPDTQRLMELLSQNAGTASRPPPPRGHRRPARHGAAGHAEQRGARLVQNISQAVPKEKK